MCYHRSEVMNMAQQTRNEQDLEHKRFERFLSRLHIFDRSSKLPVRNWLAWLGIALFIGLVIAYYATGGGG